MTAPDCLEGNLRFLFSWGDAKIVNDLDTVFAPVPFPGGVKELRPIVFAYRKLRREASGFRVRDWRHNNHREIPPAEVEALLADARSIDTGITGDGAILKRRSGRPAGKPVQCASCGGQFVAKRSSAIYCGATCRQRSLRSRPKSESVTLTTLKTTPFQGGPGQLPAVTLTEGSEAVRIERSVTGEAA